MYLGQIIAPAEQMSKVIIKKFASDWWKYWSPPPEIIVEKLRA